MTLIYPQLATGTSSQYPAVTVRVSRTVVNTGADGRSIRYADPGGGSVLWELAYSGLVDEEAAALEEFFRATEGRLRTFTFLDPFGNLLAWSEDLSGAAWQVGPLMQLQAGQSDPWATQRATRVSNGGGGAQLLAQTIEAPGDRTYCLSVYLRAERPANVTLCAGASRQVCAISGEWSRRVLTAGPASSDGPVTFGLELEAGGSVDVFGMQVEAQPGASGYKRTVSSGGVYRAARFADDELRITTEGINRHSCLVHIAHANHI